MSEYNEDEFVKHDIVFVEETHTYLVDGQEVPSVTEILKPLHRSYSSVNPSVLEYARNRGTAVHEALEMIDYGAETEVYPEIEGYVRAYLDWSQVYKPNWTDIEQIVYEDCSNFIGTLDRAGWLNGAEFAVVDIKTSQPTKEALVSVCVQTYAYADAYTSFNKNSPEWNKINRYGLFLKSDGSYRVVNCKEYEEKYHFKASNVWSELFLCNRVITNVLRTGGKK